MHFLTYCVLVFTATLLYANAQDVKLSVYFDTFNNQSFKKVKAFEGRIVTFNVSVTVSVINDSLKMEKVFLRCWMDYLKVGNMVNWTDLLLPTDISTKSTTPFHVSLQSKRLGGSNLMCSISIGNVSSTFYKHKVAQLIVRRETTIHEIIFRVIMTVFVISLTFVMGCGLDIKIIIGYFKKPISPLIGFFSQFVLMPLISAGLGKVAGIEKAFGLGLLVIGCSPGGGASNFWTVLFGGDLNLSMTMTFISSCAALVMMPFWLFVLGRLFVDPKIVKIPYSNIAINLLLVLVPAALGIAFQWKFKRIAEILMRQVKTMVLLLMIVIFTYGTYVNLYIYQLFADYAYLIPIGAMLPWLGFVFGYVFGLLTRRNQAQLIAIALETGFQNIGVAILILMYSLPQPDGDLGTVMVIVVAVFTPLPLYIGFVVLIIKRKCFDPLKTKPDVELEQPVDEMRDVLLMDSPKEET